MSRQGSYEEVCFYVMMSSRRRDDHAWHVLQQLSDPACSYDLGSMAHLETAGATTPDTAAWPNWVPSEVIVDLAAAGKPEAFAHQLVGLDLIWQGHNVIVSTGTGSGKSAIYQVPALAAAAGQTPPWAKLSRGRRHGTTIYLAPTKALAADQARAFQEIGAKSCAVLTGDSSHSERQWARDHAHVIITTPDSLHHNILPNHHRWRSLLKNLCFVVVDEAHHCRGVFGAHTAAVLRRLLRIARNHGADPRSVMASATLANPAEHAEALTGLPHRVVDRSSAPSPGGRYVLWRPFEDPESGKVRSAAVEATRLAAHLAASGCRTLVFCRSRAGAEIAARDIAAQLADRGYPRDWVAPYRAGYLPEDRRALEERLRSGQLRCVASTSALELGIDVSGLDAVLVVGWPGLRASLWQRWGRAGRGKRPGLGIFVGREDPLDAYILDHPGSLFGQRVEQCVIDPHNRHILAPHLLAAAADRYLQESDLALFGPSSRALVEHLTDQGLLRSRQHGWYWTGNHHPSQKISLRGDTGALTIVEAGTGSVVGTANPSDADTALHHSAIYLHQGNEYEVVTSAVESGSDTVLVRPCEVDYRTWALSRTDIAVQTTHQETDWAGVKLCTGVVEVSSQVTSFQRRSKLDGTILNTETLDLEPRTLTTVGVWWLIPDQVLTNAGLTEETAPGALHAAEHAAIGLLPLLVTCDRWDVGGVSTAHHAPTGGAAIFVYDGHPGGAGFSAAGYQIAKQWMGTTAAAIASCPCEAGCPSCIQSPKCGSGNQPLSKYGATRLLQAMLRTR